MFKLEINLGGWGEDETVTIETEDFDKIVAIQEFIDFQMDNDWNASWALVNLDEEDEEDEEDKEDEDGEEPVIAIDTEEN